MQELSLFYIIYQKTSTVLSQLRTQVTYTLTQYAGMSKPTFNPLFTISH